MGESETEEELKIEIDLRVCRGTGECVLRASRSFAMGDAGHARVVDVAGDSRDQVLAAARSCPHFAIAVKSGDERLV